MSRFTTSRLFPKEYMVTVDLRQIVPSNRTRDRGRDLTRYQARKLLQRVRRTMPQAVITVGQGVRP